VVAGDSGILMNNEMDDFVAKPGVPNMFGAVGGDANAIAPGKTPLSSMSPTIVFKDGKPVMAVGAPGGTRIISCVLETILNRLEHGMPLYESVASIRFHHQWKPDELAIDLPGPGDRAIDALKAMGYAIKLSARAVSCSTMAVAREGDELVGVSEPADAGSSLGL
jgi:gamma-glutamyltranspeptidase/glutathione hydrolase